VVPQQQPVDIQRPVRRATMKWLIDALWTFVPENWHCPKCGAEFETGVEMMQHYNQCKKK